MRVAQSGGPRKKHAANPDREEMPPKRTSATTKPLANGTAVDVKLPPITMEMPGVWFNQLEAYLTVKGVADRNLRFLHARAGRIAL